MDIFIYRDGETCGPFTRKQVGEYLASGSLNENDKACENDSAWSKGFRDWQPLKDIIGQVTSPPPHSELKPEDSTVSYQSSLSSWKTGPSDWLPPKLIASWREFAVILTLTTSPSDWLRPKLIASWREIAVILTLTTGYSICSSTAAVIQRWRGFSPVLYSINYYCLHSLAIEGAILALLLFFLHLRGWTMTDLKIKPDLKGSRESLSLAIASLIIAASPVRILNGLLGGTHSVHVVGMSHPHSGSSHASLILILVFCIVNACFEQVICMSYAFNQFAAKYGPRIAIGLMIVLRLSWHTWQGPVEMCGSAMAFLFFGVWYWQMQKVWPLILAHTFFDLWILVNSTG
ncbi:MAG: CPBP family intramembrane metalloprotease [Methylacidiphilales bacterium]|nr:CPBP family intramembrane metalloprotease [Candidatus Methylacidiphilales bacterium]